MYMHLSNLAPRTTFTVALVLISTVVSLAQERRQVQRGPQPGLFLTLPVDVYQVSFTQGQPASFKVHNRADQALTAITLEVKCISASGSSVQVQTNDWAVASALPPQIEVFPGGHGPLPSGAERTIDVAVPLPEDPAVSQCDALEVTPLAVVLEDTSALGDTGWIMRTFESRIEDLRVQQGVALAIRELLEEPEVAESLEIRLEELRGIFARIERAPDREGSSPRELASERKLESVLRRNEEISRKFPATSIEVLLQRELSFANAYIQGLSRNLPPHLLKGAR